MFTKRFLALGGALALGATLGSGSASAQTFQQLAGFDRYSTSVAISQRAFPTSATNVYLARGDVLADALSAGSLPDGPIVLVKPAGDNSAASNYISSLHVSGKVVALGGAGAISDSVLADVAGNLPTSRIAGASRFDTSASIARAAFPAGAKTVYIANGIGADGNGSADAVAGGALRDGPVLLINPRGSNGAARDAVSALGASEVIALGGPGAVSDSVLWEVSAGRSENRLMGANRFETSLQIANRAFPGHKGVFFVARGDVFADAVSGGALQDGPIVLSPTQPGDGINYASGYVSKTGSSPIFLGGAIWNSQTMAMIAAGQTYLKPQQPGEPQNPQSPASSPTPATDLKTAAVLEEADILTGINAQRAKKGIAPLARDPEIDAMARWWSEVMVTTGNFQHSDLNPKGVKSLLGSKCRAIGENIDYHAGYEAPGLGGPRHVAQWVASPGHYENLTSSSFSRTGIGVAFVLGGQYRHESYATQIFCD